MQEREREKRGRRLKPVTGASTGIVRVHAPPREEDDAQANRSVRRKLVSFHLMTPHAPPEQGVGRETGRRVIYTH